MFSETPNPKQPLLGRGLVLGASLVLLILLLYANNGVHRLDTLFYDSILAVHQRPANKELVIVAVDEKSLRELGRWPWPRRVHANMLDRLSANGASVVGIDLLFSDPDRGDPEGDALFARAIENNGAVVLIVGPGSGTDSRPMSEILPLPLFATAAARIAHIDFEMDRDGICRKVYLKAGLGDPHWPALGLAMVTTAYSQRASFTLPTALKDRPPGVGWMRDQPILIPFSGAPGHFSQVSYVDVLKGRVPPEVVRDRLVLVGATAVGLGDFVSTPVSTQHTLMAGVEVNANVAAALLDGRMLQEASPNMGMLFNVMLIVALVLWLLVLPKRLALFGYLCVAVLTLLLSVVLLYFRQLWISPAVALLCQTALYVSWSWLDLGQLSRMSRQLSGQMHLQSRVDPMTGLPNRTRLEERLDKMLAAGQETAEGLGLLVLNTGRHRSVIELAGIAGNDAVQKQIAARLTGALPEGNLAYRLDGAEFAILIDRPSALPLMEEIAALLVQSLRRPFQLGGDQFTINPSIGASRYPQDGKCSQDLINNAHKAMHRARKERGCNFRVYSRELKEEIDRQSTIEQGLRNPSWKDELCCVYQPQISVASGRITGVETLVRWHHPLLGEIPPTDFIPVAEREGLIVPIGNWILEQACIQGQKWRKELGLNLRIGVNVSAVQFESAGLAERVSKALEQSGLPPSSLELELTETALLAGHEATVAMLDKLKELGVELAIDDFGTGYCSLTYLKSFPIDRIKIDQSFITDIHESNESAEITRSIVAMTQGLDLQVIAEGVERPEHLEYLRQLGCEEAQGYLIGMPMTPSEFEAFVTNTQSRLRRQGNRLVTSG